MTDAYRLALAVAILAGAFSANSHAALLLYEPFDYAESQDLQDDGGSELGFASGSKWNRFWGDQICEVGDASLSYPAATSLTPTGNRGTFAGGGGGGGENSSVYERAMDSSLHFSDGDTFWLSTLMTWDSAPTGNFDKVALDDNELQFGQFDGDSLLTIKTGSEDKATSAFNLSVGTTYLLVAKVALVSGNDTVRMWIDPAPGKTAPADGTEDVTLTGYDLGTLGNDQGLVVAGTSTAYDLDEVRIGDEFSTVTGIPEPNAFLLALFATLPLVRPTRRP